ncbi:hypothetical protein [Anianabacter salinae]|uniref:hypothetical protein n=1 Tax=Anianabacter salinae TaxID=2851023 RepID=UPI00225E3C1E|nr:hypothetical protein [Anianabacter salinae]MBV0911499.1 hypothetical protein [Anianabacter salinae]
MDSELTWPEHWGPIGRRRASDLLFQFLHEASKTDPARRHVLRVVGECFATDDVVFEMKGWEAPFAVAHLQWGQKPTLPERLSALVGGRRRREDMSHPTSLSPVQTLDELSTHYPGD